MRNRTVQLWWQGFDKIRRDKGRGENKEGKKEEGEGRRERQAGERVGRSEEAGMEKSQRGRKNRRNE